MTADGYIYHSDINSVTSWTASSRIETGAYPDKGIACVRYKQFIVGFGPQTMEFFVNAGNATGSVLSRQAELTRKIGLCNSESYTSFGDSLYWVGSSPEGGISVYQLSDGIRRISIPAIEAKLSLAGASNITMSVAAFYGTTHILVRAKTATFVYCVESEAWYEWSGNAVLWDKTAAVSTGTEINVYGLSKTSTSGKVYLLNPTSRTFQDDSVAYSATMITSPIDADVYAKKVWRSIAVVGDKETSTSTINISWSDDDYVTFSAVRTVSMSGGFARARKLGQSRHRVFRFDHSDNLPLRVRAVELEYESSAV
jgi:hypothetical protein